MNATIQRGWQRSAVLRKMLLTVSILGISISGLKAESMLQLFNVSWKEVAQKMPELAEAGYTSLWLPPPTKGSGGLSVGYDLWDPFDLGSKDQRNTVATRYGIEAELLHMMEVAHRFGIRVYFDNIMNHGAFDVPGFNENTPIDIYPGMLPEDFHLRVTEDGFYRKWDNTRDWNSAWQVMNLGLSDLIDIAHETPNANFGRTEGSTHPKLSFVRHPDNPEYYDRLPNGTYVGFGTNNTITKEIIESNPEFYKEDVGAYLIRAVKWKMDRTKADGLRLDAVKHVPDYFFGQQSGPNKDTSDAGYIGGIQRQFNITRGFNDSNHRDSVFDEKRPRNDAFVFGEHLGAPPGYGGYFDAGMRLVDNDLRSILNNRLGNPNATLTGLDSPGAGGFPPSLGVTHANSHDSDFAAQKEWQHAFYMTREGVGLIYSDGYYQAETLGESGGAFPRHANTAYLGQFGDPRIPNILKVHQNFARGLQQGLWGDNDYLAFERRDNRDRWGNTRARNAWDEVTMVVMMNDNTANGVGRNIWSSFPNGAFLYQYAEGPNGSGQLGFYKYSQELGSVVVPAGGYYVWSYRTPEESNLWDKPITFFQNGEEVKTIKQTRKDGPAGDRNFNPLGLPNRGYPLGQTPEPFTYQVDIPVIKSSTFTILARADGSAENILLKLDGGIDLNGTTPEGVNDGITKRDHPPGWFSDIWDGYEQPQFIDRQFPEKFAAINTLRNKLGSEGAETYIRNILGSGAPSTGTLIQANQNYNNFDDESGRVPSWVYHSPDDLVGGNQGVNGVGDKQFFESETDIKIWTKSNSVGLGFKFFVYYTTDGSFPEGAGGIGMGTTKVAILNYRHNEGQDNRWSSSLIPKPTPGTEFIYKISAYKNEGTGVNSWWPANEYSVGFKKNMLTTLEVKDFDAQNVVYHLHNDHNSLTTGLKEGFHVLRARAFLNRNHDTQAPLYNTFTQTFYYDEKTPEGEIKFPESNNDEVGGSEYELVVRTDHTVTEVWYHIADSDLSNNDNTTSKLNGNGQGFEPFTDLNRNGVRDSNEPFIDINGNGVYDSNLTKSWARATEVTPSINVESPYPKEFRFKYVNIPSNGTATIELKLLEASSNRNLFDSPEASHLTHLERVVNTRGIEQRLSIAWPSNDLDIVDDQYILKAYFSKSIANGLTQEGLLSRFSLKMNGITQPKENWQINYESFGPNGNFHEISIPLPNLFNDVANFQHLLEVSLTLNDGRILNAQRLVLATPSTRPFIRITSPTVVGSDGRPTELILNDVPTNRELRFPIVVEASKSIETINLSTTPTIEIIESSMEEQGSVNRFTFTARVTNPGIYTINALSEEEYQGQPLSASRGVTILLRQIVEPSGDDEADDDNDGIINREELAQRPLPPGNSETWSNFDVHMHFSTGKTLPLSPDSDGDGLPDALELGFRTPASTTNPSEDTNGDGFPNFIGDLDPPFYAVVENHGFVPGVGSASQGDDRLRRVFRSTTDPLNPDTDGDGLLDGVEDSNKNGWVDGDGKAMPLLATREQYQLHRPNIGDWPNDRIDPWETWQETSPTSADSDGDGLLDGFGEDVNLNGRTDMFLLFEDGTMKELLLSQNTSGAYHIAGENYRIGGPTSRAINYQLLFEDFFPNPNGGGNMQVNGYPKLIINETDPLNADTDGDGLPDGWEVANGLDPLDNGFYNFRTGGPGDPNNGSDGDPDNDGISNLQELINGTNPQLDESLGQNPQGEGQIVVGRFTDWTHEDLLALDAYNEGGSQGADVYRTNQFDSSRDIVAFSFRDGGDISEGGTGEIYFRIDFLDLQNNAWLNEIDAYIVIDTGNPSVGERALPNSVDIATDMRWEAALALYGQNLGELFIDKNPAQNTVSQEQDILTVGGVQKRPRGQNSIRTVAWSPIYDAVEVSFSREALKETGWLGNPDSLNFQVYTTRPFTQTGGAGDLPGRNDLRDTIQDNWVVSDYWKDQANIALNGKLSNYVGRNSENDRDKYSKVILLSHANQLNLPAREVQGLLHNLSESSPAGFTTLLDTHLAFNAPLTLHITPIFATSLAWAKSTNPLNDGPNFNNKIKELIDLGNLDLLGSTYADHIVKYFPDEFNINNSNLSLETLDEIYEEGVTSRDVFWTPERVLDSPTLSKIGQMGYTHTFADQSKHFVKWFGRTAALGNEGYQINEINGIKLFPIHDFVSTYLNQSLDGGSVVQLRELLSRRARSSVQNQVVVLFKDINDFSDPQKLNSYAQNVRWLASRPWVRIVTPNEILNGGVTYKGLDNNTYTNWGSINRGINQNLRQSAQNFVDYASQQNYDNWYNGSTFEEGLRNQLFGSNIKFGQVGVDGFAHIAWNNIRGLQSEPLSKLANSVLGTSMFQTAFHNTSNPRLDKFSTGDFIYPDIETGQTLASFARNSQSQARYANIYSKVQEWTDTATPTTLVSETIDIDLDGSNELILYNSRIFAIFETKGGRMVASWVRNPHNKEVFQVLGNFHAYSNTDSENEGTSNSTAYRTSGFKDWWVIPNLGNPNSNPNSNQINLDYSISPASSNSNGLGWTFTSPSITKSIVLESPTSTTLKATYNLSNLEKSYIRFGLSPDLLDLLSSGQTNLEENIIDNKNYELLNTSSNIKASIEIIGNGLINYDASDTPPSVTTTTINRRNQAQITQTEVELNGSSQTHTINLSFDILGLDPVEPGSDTDNDGLPDIWELEYFGDLEQGAYDDPDNDGVPNIFEFKLGTDPTNPNSGMPKLNIEGLTPEGFVINFDTVTGLNYQVKYIENLTNETWLNLSSLIGGDGFNKSIIDSEALNKQKRFYILELSLP